MKAALRERLETRMKREDVKTKYAEGIQFDTHLIANPANTQEWIVFFKRMPEEASS